MAGPFVFLITVVSTAHADDGPVATTPHFAFYSDLPTNLNDALIVAGSTRNDGADELFADGGELEACFSELPKSARAGWDLAVDYYARVISPAGWMARQQYLLRADLAEFGEEPDERARRFLMIAEGFRLAATPAYTACAWPEQDAENRRWVERLLPQLELYESAITERLEELYQTPWHGLPIRVDVVTTAPPVGANTISRPPHIMVSASIADRDALEIIHHEASHTLMSREDPVQLALTAAARERDVEIGDLWHPVLFVTAGDAVRRVLESAGEPDYIPYVDYYDLWDGRWSVYHDPINETWPAYLEGRRNLSEAAADLVDALPQQN
jgi:hypothetical protein